MHPFRTKYSSCDFCPSLSKIVPFLTERNKSKESIAFFSSSVREMYFDIKSNSKFFIVYVVVTFSDILATKTFSGFAQVAIFSTILTTKSEHQIYEKLSYDALNGHFCKTRVGGRCYCDWLIFSTAFSFFLPLSTYLCASTNLSIGNALSIVPLNSPFSNNSFKSCSCCMVSEAYPDLTLL